MNNNIGKETVFSVRYHHPRFREHLRGRVSWFVQINPARGAKLQELFERIEW